MFSSNSLSARIARLSLFLLFAILSCRQNVNVAADVSTRKANEASLQAVEPRIRAIYERAEYRARSLQAEWSSDSLSYVMNAPDSEGGGTKWMRYDVVSGKASELSEASSSERRREDGLSPDGSRRVYTRQGNLFVSDLKTGKTTALTDVPPDGPISNGRPSWSPDGMQIAFVQVDRSKVRLRAMLIPGDPSYPEVRERRFARVGGEIPTLRIGVIDVFNGALRWMPIPSTAEGFYLGQVEWAGNSQELLVEQLNRFRNERDFLLIQSGTGETRTLFHEADRAWVVASIRKNAGLEWVQEGRAFVVISEKDGWRHAYLCSRNGQKETLLTRGNYDIIERVAIDERGGWYYFNASPSNATQKYLYRTRLDGKGSAERVTPQDQPGTHDYAFSPDAKWAFHTYSTFDSPPLTELVAFPSHRVVRTLGDNRELKGKMKALISRPTEFIELDIGDGVVMDAWMLKPSDFDPARKYPVLVYVYGEPHAQTVLDAWGKGHADYHRAIADLGYLVVSIDNRGTPAPKGAAWRRAVFGSLGPLSTEEQAKGLKELGRLRAYVDLSRVAIWGWSGGGSNTLNAMFRRPDVYHVGMAVAPKPQAHLYNAWFQEIYMETRETNPKGYRNASAINFADGLEGDLLIVHGSGETNTHLEIVEGLVDRLIELGKPFDFMSYPNRDHGIRRGKGTSVHLRMHMIRYLLSHLDPGPR